MVNHFSKYIFLKAMKEATASNVVSFLVNEVFYKFGVPEKVRIQVDHEMAGMQTKDKPRIIHAMVQKQLEGHKR